MKKKLKVKRKEQQIESEDYIKGKDSFSHYMTMNRQFFEKMTDNEKELNLFMAGFYSGVNYIRGK